MKLFSKDAGGYVRQLKWGVLALFGIGLLRFAMAPLGIPLSAGGLPTSLTIALLLTIVAYAVFYARRGMVGDAVLSVLTLAIAYLAAIALYLALSKTTGLDTYFTNERHFRGTVAGHILAHVQATPIVVAAGSVVSLIVFGVTRLLSRGSKSLSESANAS